MARKSIERLRLATLQRVVQKSGRIGLKMSREALKWTVEFDVLQ
jgi:hypothetical protein